ncbi:hypothetical protein Ddc_21253 [Ditylenchus destructor]|nr:hypothetical protein Ddc_21253 [Ditylenchus destructor]
MADQGGGYRGYEELKDGLYHGYAPLKPRKTPVFQAEFTPNSGMLNIACARDLDSIPSGEKNDASQYQYVQSAHKTNRYAEPDAAVQPNLTGNK